MPLNLPTKLSSSLSPDFCFLKREAFLSQLAPVSERPEAVLRYSQSPCIALILEHDLATHGADKPLTLVSIGEVGFQGARQNSEQQLIARQKWLRQEFGMKTNAVVVALKCNLTLKK